MTDEKRKDREEPADDASESPLKEGMLVALQWETASDLWRAHRVMQNKDKLLVIKKWMITIVSVGALLLLVPVYSGFVRLTGSIVLLIVAGSVVLLWIIQLIWNLRIIGFGEYLIRNYADDIVAMYPLALWFDGRSEDRCLPYDADPWSSAYEISKEPIPGDKAYEAVEILAGAATTIRAHKLSSEGLFV